MILEVRPWGPLLPEEIEAVKSAPAGEAAKIIQQYDPLWGHKGKLKKFAVTVQKDVTVSYEKTIKVNAVSIDHARMVAEDKADEIDDWNHVCEDEEYNICKPELIAS